MEASCTLLQFSVEYLLTQTLLLTHTWLAGAALTEPASFPLWFRLVCYLAAPAEADKVKEAVRARRGILVNDGLAGTASLGLTHSCAEALLTLPRAFRPA